MKISTGEKVFNVINYIFMGFVGFLTIYPFIYVVANSLSSVTAVKMGKVFFYPIDFNLEAFKYILSQQGIWIAYGNTIFYTLVGTTVNLLLTVMGAYPLSKKRLKGRTFVSFFIVFTMWFNAGMIPFYLNLRSLGILNTRLVIIIAFGITTFNVILLRTFFQSIPRSLEESAKIDGASDFQVLWKIYLPLSKAGLATVGLFYAVGRWNGYLWAMIILRDKNKIPLQVLLKKMIVELSVDERLMATADMSTYSQETVIHATIIIAIIPIICVYPYLQKYFVKGIMLGSVKG